MNEKRRDEIPEDEFIEDLIKFTYKSKIESLYVDYGVIGGIRSWKSPQDDVELMGEIDAKASISLARNTQLAVRETMREIDA